MNSRKQKIKIKVPNQRAANKVPISVWITKETKEKLKAEAAKQGMSMEAFLEEIVQCDFSCLGAKQKQSKKNK